MSSAVGNGMSARDVAGRDARGRFRSGRSPLRETMARHSEALTEPDGPPLFEAALVAVDRALRKRRRRR